MPFIQLTTHAPGTTTAEGPGKEAAAAVAGPLAEEFADALDLPPDAVIVQHTVADTVTAPGAVAVVRGRLRDPSLMRGAVQRAGTLLSTELGIHPDLVLVSWPHPGTAATGDQLLP